MSKYQVSIIMPAYNCKDTLLQAVESVLSQTYRDWELIIIDDACPSKSYQVIKYITDSRIKLMHNQENKGVAATRNVGIKQATGQYIAFLDADDYWLPDKLAHQIYWLNEGYDVVCSAYWRVTGEHKKLVIPPRTFTFKDILKSNYIGNLTGIYNSSNLGKHYQQRIGHEDYVMWLEILRKAPEAYGVQEPLAVYRVMEDSLSSNKLKAITWQWTIYRNVLKLNIVKSVYYFMCYLSLAILKRL